MPQSLDIEARRRDLLTGALAIAGVAGVALTVTPPRAEAQVADDPSLIALEVQCGDPQASSESMSFNANSVLQLFGASRANFKPRDAAFSDKLLATAASFVGVTRSTNRPQVEKFLKLFNMPFADQQSNKVIPFCAAGISYTAALVYGGVVNDAPDAVLFATLKNVLSELDHYHFFPSPSVMDIYHVAAGKHRWVAAGGHDPRPGWLVIYDWDGDHTFDHVGIVESFDANNLHTIEFNTSATIGGSAINGGCVARKTRPRNAQVAGYVNTLVTRPV